MKNILYILFIFLISNSLISCDAEDTGGRKSVYVKPSDDKDGRVRKGYVRMPVSTKRMQKRVRINQSIIIRPEGSIDESPITE